MTRVIKFGVIGCGLMGREFASAAARWFHLTDTKARPEIVAVCDLNPTLTNWFSANIPSVTQVTVDYREVLANQTVEACLLYTSPSPRDRSISRMPSSA